MGGRSSWNTRTARAKLRLPIGLRTACRGSFCFVSDSRGNSGSNRPQPLALGLFLPGPWLVLLFLFLAFRALHVSQRRLFLGDRSLQERNTLGCRVLAARVVLYPVLHQPC